MAKILSTRDGELYLDDISIDNYKSFRNIPGITELVKHENIKESRAYIKIQPLSFLRVEFAANITYIDQKFDRIVLEPTYKEYIQDTKFNSDADAWSFLYRTIDLLRPVLVSKLSAEYGDGAIENDMTLFKDGSLNISCGIKGRDSEHLIIAMERRNEC